MAGKMGTSPASEAGLVSGLEWQTAAGFETVVAILRRGGVVAMPTETLWGLSCLASHEAALRRIAAAKGIASPRGFVALVEGPQTVERYLSPTQDRRGLEYLRSVWPAPLTAVLATRVLLPWGETRDGVHTAAFRVPAHERWRDLLRHLDEPVVSTSANLTGQPPLLDAGQIERELGPHLDAIVIEPRRDTRGASRSESGLDAAGRPSTLADFTGWPPQLRRAGAFDLHAALAAMPARCETA